MEKIILASSSPRRRELMAQAGFAFEVLVSEADETIETETPGEMVEVLSERKAAAVAEEIKRQGFAEESVLLVGADTMVAIDGKKLGKPKDEADAKRMLTLLSGRKHAVYTGVTFVFLDKNGRAGAHTFYEKTEVTMKPLSEPEIDRYVATGEPMDKAGAYGIQGKCAIYIEGIEGDYNNVVGLPVARIYKELQKLGIDPYLW